MTDWPEPVWPDWPQMRSQKAFEELMFNEGLCTECNEIKQLAMVRLGEGDAFAYRQKDPLTGKEYLMSAPRVGFCEPCVHKKIARGDFSKRRKKQKAAPA